MNEEPAGLLARAVQAIKTAEKNFQNDDYNAAVNRIYYAMFYVAGALSFKGKTVNAWNSFIHWLIPGGLIWGGAIALLLFDRKLKNETSLTSIERRRKQNVSVSLFVGIVEERTMINNKSGQLF